MVKKKPHDTTAKDSGETFKVRATKKGFIDHRRREGDVFLVTAAQFSEEWMEKVDADTPLVSQTSADIGRQQFAEQLAGNPKATRLQANAADPIEDTNGDDEPTGSKNVLG